MFFREIYDSIRGRIDCRQKIKPKSDRLLGGCLRARKVESWQIAPARIRSSVHVEKAKKSLSNWRIIRFQQEPVDGAPLSVALSGASIGLKIFYYDCYVQEFQNAVKG